MKKGLPSFATSLEPFNGNSMVDVKISVLRHNLFFKVRQTNLDNFVFTFDESVFAILWEKTYFFVFRLFSVHEISKERLYHSAKNIIYIGIAELKVN